MRNVILLDDQKEITNEFASYIREIGLIPYECQTIDEALEVIDTFIDKDDLKRQRERSEYYQWHLSCAERMALDYKRK